MSNDTISADELAKKLGISVRQLQDPNWKRPGGNRKQRRAMQKVMRRTAKRKKGKTHESIEVSKPARDLETDR